MLHILKSQQTIQANLQTAWDFISSPKNLSVITPDYMKFKILSDGDSDSMYAGQIIEYTVRPLLNIELSWVTEITHVKDKEYFVDEQRFGPYAFWHHQHWLKETASGIEMTDLVHYKLPFGVFGKMGNKLFVEKQLKEIFAYRFKKVNELFN